MKIERDAASNDIIKLSEQESAELIVILDNVDKIPGLEKKYLDLAEKLKNKLWNI